ncbi:MAG: flagellar basal body rod protein FlgB [Alphaproteobacteria bacterium]|nr:flagellar basal body rod protein FlgB [Alphaproteobacteria bacterium]
MALTDSGLIRLMTERMSYLGQRQAVLAQNVANANTPKYKAKDIAPFSFNDALKEAGSGMYITDSRHIVPASMAGVNAATKKARTYETVPSGNSVEIEQQMMEVSKTAIDYQAVSGLYRKVIGLFRTAIGK